MNKAETKSKQEELEQICRMTPGIASQSLTLDGRDPQYVSYPSTDEEVAKVLSLAAKTKTSVAIVGGGSKFSNGNPLTDLEWVLNTEQLKDDPVVNTDDLTVNVKAGLTLEKLQKHLLKHQLFLPVDIGTSKTTVGGMLAAGGTHSHRLQYGAVRDLVLGLTVALTDGNVYRFGGQTVKNVAGYDVGKLFIGSKGTLGVITEACLRVYPIPLASKVFLGFITGQDAACELIKSVEETQPAVVELYDMSLAVHLFKLDSQKNNGYAVLIKYSGHNPLVEKQETEMLALFSKYNVNLLKSWSKDEDGEIWHQRNKFFSTMDNFFQGAIGTKIIVSRTKVGEMIKELDELAQKHNVKKIAMHMTALGTSYVQFESSNWFNFIVDFQAVVQKLGGFIQLTTGELSIREKYPKRIEQKMDIQIKNFFDPEKVLNTGKNIG